MTGTQWLLLISLAVTLLLTCLLLIDAITDGRVKGKMPQLAAAYRRFSSTGVLPNRYQGLRLTSFSTKQRRLGLGVLVVLSVIFSGLLLTGRDWAVESTSTQSVTPSGVSSGAAPLSEPRSSTAEGEVIQLVDVVDSARPFQPVRIQGTYRGGADPVLSVQRWDGGKWLAFPLPTKTDQSGQFSTYVKLGQPGRYRLRVLDPKSGVTSKPFVLVIKS